MTINISPTVLYIIGAAILLSVITYFILKNLKESRHATESKARSANDRQEKKRREKAAKEIEVRLNSEINRQPIIVKNYIEKLNENISPVEKKIFYNLTKKSNTNPSGLFDKLRRIFDISSEDTIYYCRRNNTTFGADDFFIISEKGFSSGDSSGKDWTVAFDEITEIQDSGYFVKFGDNNVLWEYILCYPTDQEKADFIEITNKFLAEYESLEEIYERAAISAFYERAVPLLKKLTEYIGTNTLSGKFIRACYHYSLADDNVNRDHNLEQARYMLLEVEGTFEKWAEEDNLDIKSYRLYGDCKYWEARVAWLSGEDRFVIEQVLKELQGKEYHEEVREAAAAFYGELLHND